MGDDGQQPTPDTCALAPTELDATGTLKEQYTTRSDLDLIRQAILGGWVKFCTPKYNAAMTLLEQVVKGEVAGSASVKVKAAKVLLEVSKHAAEQLAPSGGGARQAQQMIVNVANPDGPIAQLRKQWAEQEAK
jgi:hypothetical protein